MLTIDFFGIYINCREADERIAFPIHNEFVDLIEGSALNVSSIILNEDISNRFLLFFGTYNNEHEIGYKIQFISQNEF